MWIFAETIPSSLPKAYLISHKLNRGFFATVYSQKSVMGVEQQRRRVNKRHTSILVNLWTWLSVWTYEPLTRQRISKRKQRDAAITTKDFHSLVLCPIILSTLPTVTVSNYDIILLPKPTNPSITLFRSIILLCGIDSIYYVEYSCIHTKCRGIFRIILSIPHNIVMNLNNVMSLLTIFNFQILSLSLSLHIIAITKNKTHLALQLILKTFKICVIHDLCQANPPTSKYENTKPSLNQKKKESFFMWVASHHW